MQIGIVIVSLVAGLVAGRLVTGGASASKYESTVKLLVGPISADRSTLDASGLLARTYSEILESTKSRRAATAGLELDDFESVKVRAVADERSRDSAGSRRLSKNGSTTRIQRDQRGREQTG